MNDAKGETVKSAAEIDLLVKKLTPSNQSYILNTINAFLFSQERVKKDDEEICNKNL